MREHVRHYLAFLRVGWRSRLEYRVDVVADILGVTILNGVDLILIYVVVSRFTAIAGWTFWELVFLYCFYLLALGIGNILAVHLGNMEIYIRDGTFDFFLTRPVDPFVQLIGKEFTHRYMTHFVFAVAGLGLAYRELGLHWGPELLLYSLILWISSTLVMLGILLALASLAFWTVRSRPFMSATVEIQEAVQHYPVRIFGRWFELFTTLVLPFAFVNYYPSMILLGKVDFALHPWLPYLTPLAGLETLTIGVWIWRAGIRRYQSTGT